jgi:N-acetylglucosamine-6-phosphate deacetylase
MRGFHHREPGIVGFGLLNQDIYIEIIGDLHHLDQRTLELVFRVKNQERIIIVSDSVKETGIDGPRARVSDGSGRLLGGGTTVTESFDVLSQKGFDKHLLMDFMTRNPERYLSNIH